MEIKQFVNPLAPGVAGGRLLNCHIGQPTGCIFHSSFPAFFAKILLTGSGFRMADPGGRPPGPEWHLAKSQNLRKSHGEKRSGIKSLQRLFSAQIQRIEDAPCAAYLLTTNHHGLGETLFLLCSLLDRD